MNQIHLPEKDDYKVVVVSDIHGHYKHLQQLVDQMALKDEDYFIILGDFISKGKDSYRTYKVIRELEKRDRTIVLKGNHEAFFTKHFFDHSMGEEFLAWLQEEPYETIISSILKAHNKSIGEFDTWQNVCDFISEVDSEIMLYLRDLPILLHLDEFIFVHGGYDSSFHPVEEENKFLKYDHFTKKSPVQEQKVVVGHWPVSNLRNDVYSNKPLFNKEKNIISIDGGLGVKSAGELSALIINKSNGKVTYDSKQFNDFQMKTVNKSYPFPDENTLLLNYDDWHVDILERGDLLTLCRHITSGIELSVFNCLLTEDEKGHRLSTTYVNNFINVEAGAEVEVCYTYDEVTLVKSQDKFGWILTSQL